MPTHQKLKFVRFSVFLGFSHCISTINLFQHFQLRRNDENVYVIHRNALFNYFIHLNEFLFLKSSLRGSKTEIELCSLIINVVSSYSVWLRGQKTRTMQLSCMVLISRGIRGMFTRKWMNGVYYSRHKWFWNIWRFENKFSSCWTVLKGDYSTEM